MGIYTVLKDEPRTEWFAGCKPERDGIYEVRGAYTVNPGGEVFHTNRVLYARFLDGVWYAPFTIFETAEKVCFPSFAQDRIWRGLTKQHG